MTGHGGSREGAGRPSNASRQQPALPASGTRPITSFFPPVERTRSGQAEARYHHLAENSGCPASVDDTHNTRRVSRHTDGEVEDGSSQRPDLITAIAPELQLSDSTPARANATAKDSGPFIEHSSLTSKPPLLLPLSDADWRTLNEELEQAREQDQDGDRPNTDHTSGQGPSRSVEDSLFDEDEDDDPLDTTQEQIDRESEEDEVKDGVLQLFLLGILKSLKSEIASTGQPRCYESGTFWIRPKDPSFALYSSLRSTGNTAVSANVLYHRDVFIWLPQLLPGCPNSFVCECGAAKPLNLNGYNDNPIARCVKGPQGREYFLLTNQFRCDSRRKGNDSGCGKSFQGTDSWILAQLPRNWQHEFPAYLTARGAVDKVLMSTTLALFSGRFGSGPLSELLSELRHLDHSNRELIYLSIYSHEREILDLPPATPFSAFDDKSRYAGTRPSPRYCKAVFTEWMRAHTVLFDRVIASLPGRCLRGDHTFKTKQVIKSLALLLGVPTFIAMYTTVNEFEETRKQALTPTKRLNILDTYHKEISSGLAAHGHEPTEFMYTDNAQVFTAELAFHEAATPSLSKGVKHIVLDPYSNLPLLALPDRTRVHYYDSFDLIDAACENLLPDDMMTNEGTRYILGFDLEYEVGTTGQGGPGAVPRATSAAVDVVQFATDSDIYVFKFFIPKPPFLPIYEHSFCRTTSFSLDGQSEQISCIWRRRGNFIIFVGDWTPHIPHPSLS
ncbi:hypothetical protein BDZ89DRAFT_1050403 [Hymenopellis radicata]|nr:hypothetical protein BDZ89DRAFT_1050403 [Hymenopellis radicata]